jgi:hypothetical protein
MNYDIENAVIDEALDACGLAIKEKIDANPGQWYPCGFAWVKVRPARGRLVEALKERQLGKVDDFEGGLLVHPSRTLTQWMDAKEAGCNAFVKVLKKHYPELRCCVETRLD